MFQPTLLLTCYLLLVFYLITCLPYFISSLSKHLLNTEYFPHARPELDAILKAQIKCYGTQRLVRRGAWSAKRKETLGTALGTSTCSVSVISSNHPPQGVGITAEETEAQKGGATCRKSSITRHHRSNCQEGRFCREANIGGDARVRYKGFR